MKEKELFIIIFWDVDGAMVVHQFPDGKMKTDITKDPPFPWVVETAAKASMNIMVSGRGSELESITMDWWEANKAARWAGYIPMYYRGVDWNYEDKHDQRMLDYIDRKRQALKDLLVKWGNALSASNIPFELRVYEDDESVLRGIMSRWDDHYHPYLVKDGEPHEYHVKAQRFQLLGSAVPAYTKHSKAKKST